MASFVGTSDKCIQIEEILYAEAKNESETIVHLRNDSPVVVDCPFIDFRDALLQE